MSTAALNETLATNYVLTRHIVPRLPHTGDTTQDRLLAQAHSRLEGRLSRCAIGTEEFAAAINHYRRVVRAITGKGSLDRNYS
ncbi:MAG: hypothetical protein ACFCBW_10990 [Candidatus Competibacterales bacterium]